MLIIDQLSLYVWMKFQAIVWLWCACIDISGKPSLSVCALVTSSALEMVHKLIDAVKKIE